MVSFSRYWILKILKNLDNLGRVHGSREPLITLVLLFIHSMHSHAHKTDANASDFRLCRRLIWLHWDSPVPVGEDHEDTGKATVPVVFLIEFSLSSPPSQPLISSSPAGSGSACASPLWPSPYPPPPPPTSPISSETSAFVFFLWNGKWLNINWRKKQPPYSQTMPTTRTTPSIFVYEKCGKFWDLFALYWPKTSIYKI